MLAQLRAPHGAPAYDTLVAAILLQRDAGGDLAGLLRGVARSLEESARVAADARTATAQARFTARSCRRCRPAQRRSPSSRSPATC